MLSQLLNPAGLTHQPQTPSSPSVDSGQSSPVKDSKTTDNSHNDQISISYASYQSQQESLFPVKGTNESERFQTTIRYAKALQLLEVTAS